jgi:hypothetical protein
MWTNLFKNKNARRPSSAFVFCRVARSKIPSGQTKNQKQILGGFSQDQIGYPGFQLGFCRFELGIYRYHALNILMRLGLIAVHILRSDFQSVKFPNRSGIGSN